MVLRIGELLVAQGVLSEEQVAEVLAIQQQIPEPFGSICERVLGISPEVIEGAWCEQYARISRGWSRAELEFDPMVADLVTPRQAWQFKVVPVCFDDGALLLATTVKHLPRALRFATKVIEYPAMFALLEAADLAAELETRYPLAGLDARVVEAGRLDEVFGRGSARPAKPRPTG